MGLAKPYIDRRQFDDWSHERMVDAYVGVRIYAIDLEKEVDELKRRVDDLEAKEQHNPLNRHPWT